VLTTTIAEGEIKLQGYRPDPPTVEGFLLALPAGEVWQVISKGAWVRGYGAGFSAAIEKTKVEHRLYRGDVEVAVLELRETYVSRGVDETTVASIRPLETASWATVQELQDALGEAADHPERNITVSAVDEEIVEPEPAGDAGELEPPIDSVETSEVPF
jgi:hypothetical protein